MKRVFFIFLLLISLTFGRDLILVSIYPFYDVVKDIAGEGFRVESLVPPKADYHTYELSPQEVKKLNLAKVLFVSGAPLGEWEEKVQKMTKAKVFKLSEGIELLSYGHEELGKDPHFWVSPSRMIGVAKNVYVSLRKVYPQRNFDKGYEETRKKLLKLHEEYEKTLSTCKVRRFGAVHSAFGYLAKDYGLEQVVIKEEHGHEHGDISPRELARMVKEVKKGNIRVVLVPKGFSSKVARILRDEYGVEVYEINIGIIPEFKGDNYYSVMKRNLMELRKALRCQ